MNKQMNRSSYPLLFVVALPLVAFLCDGCILPPFEADCPTSGSCGTCIENSGCGWCGTEGSSVGRCLPGSSWGPDSELECTPSNWRWHDCSEPSEACNDTCYWANDGDCNDDGLGGLCDPGTDCTDCRQ